MGKFHSQAMHNVYQQVLFRLFDNLTQGQKASLQLLVQRLLVAAGGIERIEGFRVMLVYGGGHDSANTLICLRAAQLSIAARFPCTFSLRVVTASHSGLAGTVQDNIERAYSALMLHDDPRVELLVLDHDQVRLFDPHQAVSQDHQQAERREILLAGHLTGGQARATFLDRGYLEMVELYRQGSRWEGGVDAVVYALPLARRKRYLAWGRRMLRRAKVSTLRPIEASPAALFHGFALWRHQQRQQRGEITANAEAPGMEVLARPPRFITVDDLFHDPEQDHSDLLENLLGFRYDELAFGFNEASCANPLLVAHLQGLRAEWLEGRGYAQGLRDFLHGAEGPWRHPRLPVSTGLQALYSGQNQEAAAHRRALASELALRAFDLSEAQLVCLLFAPFVDKGQGLQAFVECCHPQMLPALGQMHRLLRGGVGPEYVETWLQATSGLPLSSLQMLYRRTREP